MAAPNMSNFFVAVLFLYIKQVFIITNIDKKRIKSMGIDVIWLLPIYPIGEIKRKGPQGSPYSISDYRGINPKYGIFVLCVALFLLFFTQ